MGEGLAVCGQGAQRWLEVGAIEVWDMNFGVGLPGGPSVVSIFRVGPCP